MKINPDTKDAVLFMVGLLGMIAQGVLAAFGIAPSLALIAAYLAMCGIASVSSLLGDTRYEPPRDNRDAPSGAPRKKRKARKNGNGNTDGS